MPKARSASKRQDVHIAVQKQEQTKPVPFLTGIQERVADAIGELIVSGGTRRNLDLLCRIAADHEARRRLSRWRENATEHEAFVAQRAAEFAGEWYDGLAAARANRESLPEAIRPEPKTITDLIRAQTRGELAAQFQTFLTDALPEEISLMWHVLTDWESRQSSWGDGFEEMYLANAFELQIQRRREYVRVPPHLTEDVEAYVKALLKTQPAQEVA